MSTDCRDAAWGVGGLFPETMNLPYTENKNAKTTINRTCQWPGMSNILVVPVIRKQLRLLLVVAN